MSFANVVFAATFLDRIHRWGLSNSGSIEMWIFVGVLMLITGGVFFWALNFRKQSRHHRHHHHHSHRREPAEDKSESGERGGWFGKKRRRRKRKWRANPTLAETGGLPEPRDTDQPPTA